MKAMVLRAPGDLELSDVSLPEVPAGHVLVRITHSGLCGTDLKIYKGAIPARYPLIMGHEMVGELDSGERVIVKMRAALRDLLSLPHRTNQSVSRRRLDRARDQWRIRGVRGGPGQPGLPASRFSRHPNRTAD